MSFNQGMHNKLTLNQSIKQVIQNEVKNNQPQVNNLDIPNIAISLTPIGLVFSWVIFFLILRKIRSILEYKMVETVKGINQLPCRNCRFYANNHYMKCAVQPSIVMTEEAKDCSDYSPKNDKFSPKNIFK
ncbi:MULTISPECIES: hypothetical protein [unclassified Anabaena]|uniref:hypothetical protein n=1 Tax=unclassified Anabaena TaxID=2619674 RepID=UPI00082C745F|nr:MULTISPECIES: hypothetical protein [unclassified Anabaena]